MKWIVMFGVFVFMLSCHQQGDRPKDLITEEKMTKVLWDYMKADAYTLEFFKKFDTTRNDTLLNVRYQKAIFEHHKITPGQFYKSYRYYCTHPEKMRMILDSIESIQSREKRTIELNFNKERI